MDWERFLEENNIGFVSRGPNTKRGELSVHCPYCGEDDPSEHLGISLTTENWGCLRDQSHRGKSARTLVKALLGCSSQQAGLIVKQYSHADPDTLEAALASLGAGAAGTIIKETEAQTRAKYLGVEQQFNAFSKIKVRGITRRFFDYLGKRGYENPHLVIQHYGLRCALTGRYKDRVIIPIRLNGELLGWTSRAIVNPKTAPRYLASSEDVKTTIYNFDELKEGGERLFIVEGPFDAIRVDNQLRDQGVRATCTFGTSVTVSQIALLRTLVKKYNSAWVLFDMGADGPASNLAEWTGAKQAYLPYGIKDPGDLEILHLNKMASPHYDGCDGTEIIQSSSWHQWAPYSWGPWAKI